MINVNKVPHLLILSRCKNGILELQFTKPRQYSPEFKFEEATEKFVTSLPRVRDPLDHRNVFVNQSTIPHANEGLFAKRNIPPRSVIVYLAGVKFSNSTRPKRIFKNMTMDEIEDIDKNVITLIDDEFLDIPPAMSNIIHYRATLGHKVKFEL